MTVEMIIDPVAPEKAIEYWKTRRPLTEAEKKNLTEGAKARAMTVAGLFRHQQLAAVHEALEKALAEGKTLADFKKEIKPLIKQQGWGAWRVENIFRTNLAAAYAAGAWAEIQATKEAFPYLEYISVDDDRTRPAHAVLNGKVFPVDHEFWDHNYPPNGFGCRCATAPVSRWRAEKKGLKIEKELPSGLVYKGENGFPIPVAAPGADPGFTQNVGKDWLAGLTPQEIDGVLDFSVARTVCPLGGEFAGADGPCGLWLKDVPVGNVVEFTERDILPPHESAEYYALEFLKEFGIKDLGGWRTIKIPGTNYEVPITKTLLSDKKTGKLKTLKEGRGPYMRLLAETIKNPFEVWGGPVGLDGKTHSRLSLIRLFRLKGADEVGGFASFHWLQGIGWQGATVFAPKVDVSPAEMLEYLERERKGFPLYRETLKRSP